MTKRKRNKNNRSQIHYEPHKMYELQFIKLDDGSDGIVLTHPNGCIISIEEMNEIAEKLMKTTPQLSSEEIKTQNKKVWSVLCPEMFSDMYEKDDSKEKCEKDWIKTKNKKVKQSNPGFIYIIRAEDSSIYKIGKTKDMTKRMYQFDKQYPFNIELYTYFKSNDISNDEKSLHKQFEDKKQKGEWFQLDEYDLEIIKNFKQEIFYD